MLKFAISYDRISRAAIGGVIVEILRIVLTVIFVIDCVALQRLY